MRTNKKSRRKPKPLNLKHGYLIFFMLAALLALFCLIKPRCATPKTHLASDVEFSILGGSCPFDNVSVYLDGKIQTMPLEKYLIGVVAAEMPAAYELEALKAQAVAARTYTVYKAAHGGCSAHKGADICTDSAHCQAYLTEEKMNARWKHNKDKYLASITAAVESTKGEMIYYDDEQIQVFYHASSGGRTENCENVYSKALPYLVGVKSAGEETSANYYAKVVLSRDDFIARMKAYSPNLSFKNSKLIGEITRFESGRVKRIQIGDNTFSGREIRSIFSLNSTNFSIDVSDSITFSTIGYGHGVGLSQTGANAMAKKGASYIDILTHYFTGVTIK